MPAASTIPAYFYQDTFDGAEDFVGGDTPFAPSRQTGPGGCQAQLFASTDTDHPINERGSSVSLKVTDGLQAKRADIAGVVYP
jgi:hypothetical protein